MPMESLPRWPFVLVLVVVLERGTARFKNGDLENLGPI